MDGTPECSGYAEQGHEGVAGCSGVWDRGLGHAVGPSIEVAEWGVATAACLRHMGGGGLRLHRPQAPAGQRREARVHGPVCQYPMRAPYRPPLHEPIVWSHSVPPPPPTPALPHCTPSATPCKG